jgi:hypothetical protein
MRYLAQATEGLGLGGGVARLPGQRQGQLVMRGGSPPVAGQPVHKAQVAEGVSLIRQVADVTVQRCRVGQALGRSRVVSGVVGERAEFAQRGCLAEPVS